MRLFSEKVVPTFTSSNLNILTVKDYNEIFFDVFEFEINGKKFIAEKVSNYKGSPVVDIPLVLEGKEFTATFVLQRGKFEILFNKANSTFVGPAVQEATEPIIQFVEHENEIEDIVFEKKESILKEIHQAKQSAEQYVKELKQQKLRETTKFFDDKKQILDREIDESKKSLLDEFLSLVENVKSEFYEFNESEKTRLVSFIKESIDSLSDDLSKDIEDKNEQAEKVFSEKINELATNVLSGVLLKEIDSNNKQTNKDITSRFEVITTSLNKLTEQRDSRLKGEMKEILGEYSGSLNGLEQANVELNDLINKSNNKALSRIGNVKTQLEESILYTGSDLKSTIKELENKIILAEDKIITFYDERINLVETKVTDLTEENKQYFINLIEESRQTLLGQISNIKIDIPNIVIEKSNGKQEVNLKGIKTELEKIIGTRFSNELQSLKRLIEMSSGGGSVAQQFANGGTMNGTLNVTGQYLSGGVDLHTIISNSGVAGGGDVAVGTLVRSSSADWNSAYTGLSSSPFTLINVISAIQPVRGNNTASGDYSNVAGGRENTACGYISNVAGGYCNTAGSDYSNVAGGCCNTASGYISNVAGGRENKACYDYTNVAGGFCNTAVSDYSNVAGGCCNSACGYASNVGGGFCNTTYGEYSNVAGGGCNVADGNYSTIAGGYNNTHEYNSCFSSIGGGSGNRTSSGYWSTIAGGVGNTTSSYYSAIGGGYNNIANRGSTVAGGQSNTACGEYSTVAGGYCNAISTYSAFMSIAGGCNNTISGTYGEFSFNSSIGGGGRNTICSNSTGSTIAGGQYNIVGGCGSNVAGGFCNTALGKYSNVAGGCNNKACGESSNVAGGCENIISAAGLRSGILGGCGNLVCHANSFTIGSALTSVAADTTHMNNVRVGGNLVTTGSLVTTGKMTANGQGALSSLNINDVMTRQLVEELLVDPAVLYLKDDFINVTDSAQNIGIGWIFLAPIGTGTIRPQNLSPLVGVIGLHTSAAFRASTLLQWDVSNIIGGGGFGFTANGFENSSTIIRQRFQVSSLSGSFAVGFQSAEQGYKSSRFFGLRYARPSLAWAAGKTINLNEYRRPTVSNGTTAYNGRKYFAMAITTVITGNVEPIFPNSAGARVYEGSNTLWTPSTVKVVGNKVVPTLLKMNGRTYIVSVAGITGTTEPTFPATGTVVDGTVTWTVSTNETHACWVENGIDGHPNILLQEAQTAVDEVASQIIDTGIPVVANTWIETTIKFSALVGSTSFWNFFVYDTLVGTLTMSAGNRAATFIPCFRIENTDAVANNLSVDYFILFTRGFIRPA